MQLPYSTRAPWWARALAAPAAMLRTLALGVAGLFMMAFTLVAALVGAAMVVVLALVARRRLRQAGVRFNWPERMPGGGSGFAGSTGTAAWRGRGEPHGGEVIEAEVREIRDPAPRQGGQ
ncbi:hypothetical protein [Azohydromonas lata]|uniref:Uncharacterized protein n=1 Tax=Azohydromonas lata TaxID=45677 RepID=A0ABU5IA99_9BURK|nr:hypothetical protein [Azohydromonas lata]MDZ5456028.1 hypothetical protein [Azohydromonas lata]